MYRLFIDDERFPVDENAFTIARTSEEAFMQVVSRGLPIYISFDHDLGGDDTAMNFIHNLAYYMYEMELKFPPAFDYHVHSQNPVGSQNIINTMKWLLNSFGFEDDA